MRYIHRVLEKSLRRFLDSFPVVGITGPRQSGKSTLLKHVLKDYTYVTFDDARLVHFFEEDPEGFMKVYANKIIFDEVQYVPDLFQAIKKIVDNDRQNYGKFVLTASSQFLFLKNITESLAGRIGLLSLLPFQYSEIPHKLTKESIYKGCYPELVDRSYKNNDLWYAAYSDTYLSKDVRTLSNIGDLRDFRRFIHLLAANASCLLNMTSYARDLGVSVPTIKRWLSILEASYIIFLLPPYYQNMGKRIVKSPKIYFYDTGLISHLTGIETFSQYEKGPMAGAIFENYIVSEIQKKELHNNTRAELFYLLTSENVEIDLIVDRKKTQDFIEIKKTSTFKPKMISAIKQFLPAGSKGYLLYNGEKIDYSDNLNILNYSDYLK